MFLRANPFSTTGEDRGIPWGGSMSRHCWLLSCLWLLSSVALADTNSAWVPLTEGEIYKRCYTRMVRGPVPANDALLAKVEAGQITGAVACLSLFDTAKMVAGGATGSFTLTNTSDLRASAIVKTFNDLHRSWFQSKLPGDTQFASANAILRDQEEPALFFTKALLATGAKYSDILTVDQNPRGVRIRDIGGTSANSFQAQLIYRTPATFPPYTDFVVGYQSGKDSLLDVTPVHVPDAQLTQLGRLVGIEPLPPFVAPIIYPVGRTTPYIKGTKPSDMRREPMSTCKDPTCTPAGSCAPDPECVDFREAAVAASTNVDINRNIGGGILGSFGFVTNSTNLTFNVQPFYEKDIHRRIGERVFEDLMCQQLPVFNVDDVGSYVDTASEYPFRQSTACMSCHAGMDNVALTYRNVFAVPSANPVASFQMIGQGMQTLITLPPKAGSNAFVLQGPTGALTFRQRVGPSGTTLGVVKIPVTGLDELGAAVSQQREFYYCAAKRYYQFFTGISVSLAGPETDPVAKRHQNTVIALGEGLKKNQSLRTLFQAIFNSDSFKTRNYKAEDNK